MAAAETGSRIEARQLGEGRGISVGVRGRVGIDQRRPGSDVDVECHRRHGQLIGDADRHASTNLQRLLDAREAFLIDHDFIHVRRNIIQPKGAGRVCGDLLRIARGWVPKLHGGVRHGHLGWILHRPDDRSAVLARGYLNKARGNQNDSA